MDFSLSPAAQDASDRMWAFMREEVFPAEPEWAAYLREHGEHARPPVMERLKESARARGLWNLFLPSLSGLTNLDYAPVAEISGWSPVIAPEAINCQAPDTGNMEVLHMFGTKEQKERWLEPLLAGEIRSAFAMTEPGVASSDATNIQTSIVRDGDEYVVTGRKWWISGVADERCEIYIVMGQSAPDAAPYRRQSMILVPRDTPGVTIVRHLPIFGYQDQHGHSELVFDQARVPASNLLAADGDGFAIAQARLGPGRIHHAMRAIGMAERALALMVERAKSRTAFGTTLADQGVVRELIAQSRIEIDQVRLYVYKTAWLIDREGARAARSEVAGIKVAAPAVATGVIDRAIEVFGAAGVSDDTPLAYFYAWARALRIADGPDAVHRRSIARQELRRERPFTGLNTHRCTVSRVGLLAPLKYGSALVERSGRRCRLLPPREGHITLKKAEIVADQIEQTIVGQRWEPGELFGSEVDLITRYGVSRAVFREAVRLLEHHGLAEMRRGLHGGLFIRQPDLQPVAKAMAVYLDFEKVEPRQLEDARLAIEVFCVERVAARISEDEVAEVRAYLAVEAAQVASGRTQSLHDFHVLVARLTANPALHLFVQTLTHLTQRQQPVLERNHVSLDDIHAAHAKIAEAIIARDGALARHRMMTHLEEVSAASTRRPPSRPAVRPVVRPAARRAVRLVARSEERSVRRGEERSAARDERPGLPGEPATAAPEPVG